MFNNQATAIAASYRKGWEMSLTLLERLSHQNGITIKTGISPNIPIGKTVSIADNTSYGVATDYKANNQST